MVSRNEVFPSKYLKACDLPVPRIGTIREAGLQEMTGFSGKPEKKLVLYFEQHDLKPFIVNRGNWDTIADIFGDETENWIGGDIELYPAVTLVRGEEKETVRVRKAGSKAKPRKATPTDNPKPDFNDEISI